MQVIFLRSFAKDLKKIRQKTLRREVQLVIEQIEQCTNLYDLPNVKHLSSEGQYYRIRIGEYRLGLLLENDRDDCAISPSSRHLPLLSVRAT